MASINILPKTVEEYCCPILCSQGDARINNPNPDEPIRISKTRVNILFSTTASFLFYYTPTLTKSMGYTTFVPTGRVELPSRGYESLVLTVELRRRF